MWRLGLAAAPVLALALAVAGGVASQTDTPTPTPEASSSSSPSPSPSPSPEPTAEPAPEVLPPTPPPAPPNPQPAGPPQATLDPAYTGSLRPGDWAQVTGTGSCLTMRAEPLIPSPAPGGKTYDNIINCLPDGFIGRLDGSGWGRTTIPVLANERWWWHVVGQGWAADEFLALHHRGGLPWPERPDLANAGLIAYIGTDNNIWLMNADGSQPRTIVGRTTDSEYFYNLAWSPSGDRLSFTVTSCCPAVTATRIIDQNGGPVVELAGLTGARWSPDGTRLSALRHHSAAGLGDNQTPVVFDLNAGTETAVGAPSYIDTAPAWSPDGSLVTFVCMSSISFMSAPDGSSVETHLDCDGGPGLRVVPASGGEPRVILPFAPESGVYYRNPSWSGDGGTIAVVNHAEGTACRGYTLVDAQTGATGSCIAFPPLGNFGGGCGWPADASVWSQDGRYLAYSYSMGNASNGVHIVDVNTNHATLVPSMGSSSINLQSGGANFTFSTGGHIWVAGLDGSNLTLLAEGHSPAWQPAP